MFRKILSRFLSIALKQTTAGPRSSGTLVLVLYLRCRWCTRRLLYDPFTSNGRIATVVHAAPERVHQNVLF